MFNTNFTIILFTIFSSSHVIGVKNKHEVMEARCAVVPQCFPVARRRRMFHPPANAPPAAVAYRTMALNVRRQDGGPADRAVFFKF